VAADRMPGLASKTVLWKLAAIPVAALLLGVIWVSINHFSSLTVDPSCQRIEVHWKGRDGKILGDLGRLKAHIEDSQNKLGRRKLILGMNAGMFLATPQGHPMGLLVVHGQTGCCSSAKHGSLLLNRGRAKSANFYLQPNGVFYVTKGGKAGICTSRDFPKRTDVQFATQSGPMLLINGQINRGRAFSPSSNSLFIRNGVGVRKDGHVVFALSNRPVNFHQLAEYMLRKGCYNALYLDGGVSAMYCPRLGRLCTGSKLGPMLAVIE
jgi:uncharacterized protein YigE (DUF2233 family)